MDGKELVVCPAYRSGLALVLGGLLWALPVRADGEIRISNAWINEPPPGMNMMGGYLDISNDTANDIVLTGASSPWFEKIEFHNTEIRDGVSRMRRQDSITIPAGSEFRFSPGRYHLMLINTSRKLGAGDKVPLSFIFAGNEPVEIEAEIRRGPPADHRHH